MSTLTERALEWLKPTREGLLGLRGAMDVESASSVLRQTGSVREGSLPSPALRLLESFGELTSDVLFESACVFRDGALVEARAHVKLYDAAAKRELIDAIGAALDAIGAAREPGRWTLDGATFAVRASADDVLEEGMPIDLETTVRW